MLENPAGHYRLVFKAWESWLYKPSKGLTAGFLEQTTSQGQLLLLLQKMPSKELPALSFSATPGLISCE